MKTWFSTFDPFTFLRKWTDPYSHLLDSFRHSFSTRPLIWMFSIVFKIKLEIRHQSKRRPWKRLDSIILENFYCSKIFFIFSRVPLYNQILSWILFLRTMCTVESLRGEAWVLAALSDIGDYSAKVHVNFTGEKKCKSASNSGFGEISKSGKRYKWVGKW